MRCLVALFCIIFLRVTAWAFTPPADIPEATDLCDKTDLRPVEGLWTYPDDDVTVLVYRSEDRKGVYDIFVVEAADCSLSSGMQLGELHSTADPNQYTIQLYTNVRHGLLTAPCEAIATFSESKEALTVKRNSSGVRINPTRLLPSFWRIVSVSVNAGLPTPEGMIKIYPSYDGNNSSKRAPRYL